MQALPLARATNVTSSERAVTMLTRALAINPADAMATGLLAYCHAQLANYHATASVAPGREMAQRLAERAGLLDGGDPLVTIARGSVASLTLQAEEEDALATRALAMDPTSAWAWERRGYIRTRYPDEADAAIEDFQRAIRLKGPGMQRAICLNGIALAHCSAGRHAQAAVWVRKALAENPQADWMHKLLSCCANKLGDKATVAHSVDHLRRVRPHLTVAQIVEVFPLADVDWLEAITRAGMPIN
jgi:tetratricopeptide (TPR) repeat protein